MSCETGHFLKSRVLPHDDVIILEAMSTDKLILVFGEDKVTDLAVCLETFDLFALMRVPKTDGSISCSSPRDEERMLMRTPCDCLHTRLMF